MNKNKILMTGATGFLGSHLLKSLVDQGHEVFVLKRQGSNMGRLGKYTDIVQMSNLEELSIDTYLKKVMPDIIIHCATDYGRKNIEPTSIIEANLILPLKLLESCGKYGIKCFINTDTILDKRISHYSLSKKQFKDWLETYSKEMTCVNVALEHFYGPFDDKTKFVSYIIDLLLSNAPEIKLTEGKQKRDFIYIDDVINAFMLIINNVSKLGKGYFQYEVGTDTQIGIRQLVQMIKDFIPQNKTSLRFGALPYRENEQMESHVDSRAITNLGWSPNNSLEQGLMKTVEAEKGIIR